MVASTKNPVYVIGGGLNTLWVDQQGARISSKISKRWQNQMR